MATKEEIRELLAQEHGEDMWKDPFYDDCVTEHDRESCRRWADKILSQLDSKGIAIKVKREPPKDINELVTEASEGLGSMKLSDYWIAQSYIATALHKCHSNMVADGFSAFDSLIE